MKKCVSYVTAYLTLFHMHWFYPLRAAFENLKTVKDPCFRSRSEFKFAHCVLQNTFDSNKK